MSMAKITTEEVKDYHHFNQYYHLKNREKINERYHFFVELF